MMRFILILVMTSLPFALLAQKSEELEKRHGFKDIKLEMPVDSLISAKFKKDFKEQDEFPAKLYGVEHPDYDKIGEVPVKKIEVEAYKGLIYQIVVTVDKDVRLMKALESIYGKALYDLKNEQYVWHAETMMLTYKSLSRTQLELRYTSFTMLKMMKADKEKKVEAIADDF